MDQHAQDLRQKRRHWRAPYPYFGRRRSYRAERQPTRRRAPASAPAVWRTCSKEADRVLLGRFAPAGGAGRREPGDPPVPRPDRPVSRAAAGRANLQPPARWPATACSWTCAAPSTRPASRTPPRPPARACGCSDEQQVRLVNLEVIPLRLARLGRAVFPGPVRGARPPTARAGAGRHAPAPARPSPPADAGARVAAAARRNWPPPRSTSRRSSSSRTRPTRNCSRPTRRSSPATRSCRAPTRSCRPPRRSCSPPTRSCARVNDELQSRNQEARPGQRRPDQPARQHQHPHRHAGPRPAHPPLHAGRRAGS